MKLSSESGLVLKDADGSTVWSTNVSSKSVASLNLAGRCNLMLLDDKSATVWQSFDHPTNTLVLGQKLVAGQQLISTGGLYSLSLTSEGLSTYINSNPSQHYFSFSEGTDNTNFSYALFTIEGVTLVSWTEDSNHSIAITSKLGVYSQYMRFEPDGHLRVYAFNWSVVFDLLTKVIGTFLFFFFFFFLMSKSYWYLPLPYGLQQLWYMYC